MATGIKVLKFGGTSMGSSKSIRAVAQIIERARKDSRGAPAPRAVVVSAMSGVTDQLVEIAARAAQKDVSYKKLLAALRRRHIETIQELVSRKRQKEAQENAEKVLGFLESVVKGVYLVQECSPGAQDLILSYGERLSAHILADVLNDRGVKCEYLNARHVITTNDTFGSATVDFDITNKAIRSYFKAHKPLQIVTGFIASTEGKKTTTLGRGGSDYTASIIGAALGARAIELWTDVSGVFTADPRIVEDALPVTEMTYEEAAEMSYFGAKVIHPPTMHPAQAKNIPIIIKNTFDPEARGTVVSKNAKHDGRMACGVSSVHDVAILQIRGAGMVRVRRATERLFGALAHYNVNVILITQSSSEHTISIAMKSVEAARAKRAIEEEFKHERADRLIEEVVIQRDLSIIAVVGEGMKNQAGVAGRFFGTLGKNSINIVAIAQGSSEHTISVVVARKDETQALKAVHTAFFFPETKIANICLVGTGLIGGTLLKQIAEQREVLEREYGFVIRVVGVANSDGMAFDKDGIDPTEWKKAITRSRRAMSLEALIKEFDESDLQGKIFVDCTASEVVAQQYARILRSQISVVTPNKRANSGSYAYYKELEHLSKKPGVTFLYETNACAALPMISMVDDLVMSGDKITKIEGVFSGTLSYLFNTFVGDTRFSDVVAGARKEGYTEPDPRDDLSGADVARKILILARECEIPLEFSDIHVEGLVSARAARARTPQAFLKELKREDAEWEKKKRDAEGKNKRLRYIATLENGRANVGLQAVSPGHPFYELSGSDNVVAIHSKRYSKTPLVVKGPGAGGEVTAAGVFADILRAARDAA